MVAGLLIYLFGQKYLPPEQPRRTEGKSEARHGFDRHTILILLGIGLSVTVFRAAYEQLGNTAWFQSLNPLFVMLLTPPLLAYWRRHSHRETRASLVRRMSLGSAIVGSAYLLLAGVVWTSGAASAGWAWLALFFLVLTFGELFILPTGLGLFARLAPPQLGATTVAAWFLVIFSGSLSAGLVGTLWSRFDPANYFLLLAVIAGLAALLLRAVSLVADPPGEPLKLAAESD
jgi:POT family proton-dependent oligopeptide transporter